MPNCTCPLSGVLALPDFGEQPTHPWAVLLADVLLDLAFRIPHDVEPDRPRLGVGARIVDGGFVAQGVEILPCEALDEMHPIGMWIAGHIDPAAFVESHDIDDERVAVPVPH